MTHRRTCPPRIERAANLMKLLGDPTRLEIVVALARSRSGYYVYEVAECVGISHSAASHQLGLLEAHDVLRGTREGQTVRYAVAPSRSAKRALELVREALY